MAALPPRPVPPPHPNPAPLTLAMVRAAVEAEEREALAAAGGDAGALACYTPTPPERATHVRLSRRGIPAIANLGALRQLRRLRLDNNALTEIGGGLDGLPVLEAVDLSFNRLTSLRGLGRLPALLELSVHGNAIEGLGPGDDGEEAWAAGVPLLQLLQLGSNAIVDLPAALAVLQRLPGLRALTLDSNPGCVQAGDSYRARVVAALGAGRAGAVGRAQLRFLDAQLITEAETQAAREGGAGVPASVLAAEEDREAGEVAAARRDAEAAAAAEALAADNVAPAAALAGDALLLAGDGGHARVRPLRGVPAAEALLLDGLRDAAAALVVAAGANRRAVQTELAAFDAAADEAARGAQQHMAGELRAWERRLKLEARQAAARHTDASKGGHSLESSGQALGQRALMLELRTHERVEDLLDALEGALAGLRASKLAAIDAFFRAAETLESAFTDACQRIADAEASAVGTGGGVGQGAPSSAAAPLPSSGRALGAGLGLAAAAADYEDEMLLLLADREGLQSVLAGAHASRVGCMRDAEAAMARVAAERATATLAERRTAEHRRDRARVAEARQLAAHAEERAAAVAAG